MQTKRNLTTIYNPLRWTSEVHIGIDDLEWTLARKPVNMSPSYQRGNVWTRDQQERFMGHLLEGGEVMPIIFQRDERVLEILDGKQRLTAILCWLRGECGAILSDGSTLFIGDLETRVRGDGELVPCGLSHITIRARYINLPFEERKRFYVKLNGAGTPHTKEQLEAALAAEPD